jgi:phosphoribosylformimino-5-aminoimidazole carboxamide ribotide isomerase
MTCFRPCIDLHQGQVKQIVGGTLRDSGAGPTTNFVATEPAEAFAARYREDRLEGGHVIKLGPGNDQAARAALAAWPGHLQIGGGVDSANAMEWIAAGAGKVIVTSWLFPDGAFAPERLRALSQLVGRERLVVDLSCRRQQEPGGAPQWLVATERWQRLTAFAIDAEHLGQVARWCDELLVHAADVEGLCRGIDAELVAALGRWSPVRVTYAGGGSSIADLALVAGLSAGAVDLTFGSALDIFGGTGVRYQDCVAWNRRQPAGPGHDAC